jgi:hypothetical protein
MLCHSAGAAVVQSDTPALARRDPSPDQPAASPVPSTSIEKKQVVELLSLDWQFTATEPPLSVLEVSSRAAHFSPPPGQTNSFTVKFTFDSKTFEGQKTILEISNVLSVRLRQHDRQDRKRQNYPAFKMPDGSVPVLEAMVLLQSAEHPDWKEMTVGIPLAMLAKPQGQHEVVLHFSGVGWEMYVDGEKLDNDFPFGYPQWAATNQWRLDPEFLRQASIYIPGIQPQSSPSKIARTSPGIQYWLPRAHNNWVGDVETIYYQGRYHIFYLYDRRHHQSKFGCGAHYFEHLSTADFRKWTEHEAATPLEDQWECIGTGVPFAFQNKLCLSYGLHTTRVYPQEKTTLPAQWEYLKTNGSTGTFRRDATPGVPAGATYSVSADGIANFRKTGVMFHPCENPSVYTDPNGKLRLLANYRSRGTWESESVNGGWRCINPNFPPGGDCTIFFRWGRYDYVIGGFTGLWSKSADAPESAYEDMVRKGLDFYDGSNVPAVTEIPGGRFLMAAWIPIRGWGGNLILRELLQASDGRIGSKWMKEVMPETEAPVVLSSKLTETASFPAASEAFLLTFTVERKKADEHILAIDFVSASSEETGCEFQLHPDDRRAQFGPSSLRSFASKEKSLREGGAPQQVGNYATENLDGVAGPFTVRLMVMRNEKIGGSLIDAEIAGQRTMITYRPELRIDKMIFQTRGLAVRDVQLSKVRD